MDTSTRGLRYRLSIPNYLAMRAMDRVLPKAVAAGRLPGLEYGPWAPTPLPGGDWLRVRPILSGVCGSDMALLTAKSSPALSPFTSFPAVLGHEVVAKVVETGPDVDDVAAGTRVVIDPYISCEMRSLEPCPSCSSGRRCLCTQTAEGTLSPGMLIGFCRDLPGSWSDQMVVHRSQVYPVPPDVPDTAAVLVEPFSIAVHAVLKRPPEEGTRVLVLGGGSVGLLVLAALRLLDIPCHVTVVARYPFQARMASRMGADEVRTDARVAAREIAGAREYRPLKGRAVYAGGFDWVFDCVGSARSMDESMRVAGPGGKVMVVGCVGEVSRLDLSFIWSGELEMTGSYGYATERSLDGSPHTFEVSLRLLRDHPEYPLSDLVTHRFPLTAWRDAMRVNLDRGREGAIKTTFYLDG
jgi:L-iditol 2-dehydrogenase